MDEDLERLREALESRGVKLTQQRIEIFREVCRSEAHPTVSEVHEAVRGRLPSISLDTVYRTLWLFSEIGIVNPVSTRGGRVMFDSNLHQHHHFVCARCGETIDFQCTDLDRISVPDEARSLGWVWGAHMEVRGLCNGCREAMGPRRDEVE